MKTFTVYEQHNPRSTGVAMEYAANIEEVCKIEARDYSHAIELARTRVKWPLVQEVGR